MRSTWSINISEFWFLGKTDILRISYFFSALKINNEYPKNGMARRHRFQQLMLKKDVSIIDSS